MTYCGNVLFMFACLIHWQFSVIWKYYGSFIFYEIKSIFQLIRSNCEQKNVLIGRNMLFIL